MSQLTTLFASSLVGLGVLAALPAAPQSELQAAAESLCRQTFEQDDWESGTAVIAIGGETIFSIGHGTTARGSKAKTTAESSLAAAPMAHAFLTALVLENCAQGDLGLDDELGKLLPELVGEDCHVHVRHLMSHTSGFVDCGAGDSLDDGAEGMLWERLQRVVKQDPETSPGECVAPTTTDTLLLAALLERLEKRPAEAILQTRLFDELGMSGSRCVTGDDESSTREAASNGEEEAAAGFDPRWLETSAEDLVRFQRALIDYELFGKAEYLEMSNTTRLSDGTHSAFGLGLRQVSVAGVRGLRAGGADEDTAAWLAHFPEHDMTISVIGRGGDLDAEYLISDLAMLVIAPPEAKLVDILLEPDAMKPYLGTYQIGCTSLIIRPGEGRLILDDAVAGELILLNQGDHHFVVESDHDMQLSFEMVDGQAASFVLDDHGVEAVATRFQND